MGLAGVPTKRNLVIASVQTGSGVAPVYFESDIAPYQRPNGGDLVKGDQWYNTQNEFIYSWNGYSWVAIGGEGMYNLMVELVERVETLEGIIGNGIADGGNAFITNVAPMEGS